jgi:hypothetical protein
VYWSFGYLNNVGKKEVGGRGGDYMDGEWR